MILVGSLGRSGGPFGVGLWKEILKGSSWVKENWKFRIENGYRIRFWKDHWCGLAALNPTFPFLFDLAVNKSETIEEV